MFMQAYKRAASVLAKRPIKLWGLSLLSVIVCLFAAILTFPFLGLIGSAFSLVVAASMSKVYLDALEGKEVNSDQLFAGFKRFWTVLGGIAWQALWLFIWAVGTFFAASVVIALFGAIGAALRAPVVFAAIGGFLSAVIAIAGAVLVIIKEYSYAFVPYILMTREDVSATQALRLSKQLTRGKRASMFVADLLFVLGIVLAAVILAAFSAIPYAGAVFSIVLVIFLLSVTLFGGIFQGLYQAAFYQMPEMHTDAENDFDARLDQFAQKLTETQETPDSPETPEISQTPESPEMPEIPETPQETQE